MKNIIYIIALLLVISVSACKEKKEDVVVSYTCTSPCVECVYVTEMTQCRTDFSSDTAYQLYIAAIEDNGGTCTAISPKTKQTYSEETVYESEQDGYTCQED